jgi:hypothetical protein
MTRAEQARRHIEDPNAFEHTDAKARTLYIFLAALFAGTIVVLLVVGGILAWYTRDAASEVRLGGAAAEAMLPPQPRLERAPGEAARETLNRQEEKLQSYGWVDRKAGVVHIPIERAMELVIQRGLPVRKEGQAPAAPATGPQSGGPQTGAPQERQAR